MFLRRNFKPERRRRERQLLNTAVRVFTKSGCLEALGINISDHGMCLFTIAHLPLDSQIELEFALSRSTGRARVSGVVRHRALYLYGIEFLAEPDQNSAELRDATTTAY